MLLMMAMLLIYQNLTVMFLSSTSKVAVLSVVVVPLTVRSPVIVALPPIVDAVNDRAEVWLDGGIRSGQDVLRTIALGAQGTLIGRAFLYGLGANGQAGVTQALEIIHKELDLTMGLCGQSELQKVGSSILLEPGSDYW